MLVMCTAIARRACSVLGWLLMVLVFYTLCGMKHCGGELSSAPNPHVGDNLIGIHDDDEVFCSF